MSGALANGSPGNHPYSDRPNWQPGDDDADELLIQKIADALRDAKANGSLPSYWGCRECNYGAGA
jgi:hypothetical protein